MAKTRYYMELTKNPHLEIKWLSPLIKAAEDGRSVETAEAIPLRGAGFTILAKLAARKENGEIVLTLFWGDGEEQAVPIRREGSNLVPGSYVYYFVCPSGVKCRKLYYIGSGFASRRAFPHYYHNQNTRRPWRDINPLFSAPDPYRRNGKEYYRGRLTPYGQRLRKYEERKEKGYEALAKLLLSMNEETENINK